MSSAEAITGEKHVPIAKSISIRDAGFDEYWLQEQICEAPSCLGLGDLDDKNQKRG